MVMIRLVVSGFDGGCNGGATGGRGARLNVSGGWRLSFVLEGGGWGRLGRLSTGGNGERNCVSFGASGPPGGHRFQRPGRGGCGHSRRGGKQDGRWDDFLEAAATGGEGEPGRVLGGRIRLPVD